LFLLIFHSVLCSCSSYLFFSLICFPFRFLLIFSWLLSLYWPYSSCLTPRSRQISDPPVEIFNQSPPSTHTHPSLCASVETHVSCHTIHFLTTFLVHVTWPAEPRRLVRSKPTSLYEEHNRLLCCALTCWNMASLSLTAEICCCCLFWNYF